MKNKLLIIGRKVGMVHVFEEKKNIIPTTIVYIKKNRIKKIIENKKEYIMKFSIKKEKKNKNIQMRINKTNIKKGELNYIKAFKVKNYIDIKGISIGKGFCGTIKKYKFKGLEASHGVSKSHRSQGSTGQCQDPGKVFKGKKMAGQKGNKKITIQNIEIVYISEKLNIIMLKGGVVGKKKNYIKIKNSVKKTYI